jgi:hypothetical protein
MVAALCLLLIIVGVGGLLAMRQIQSLNAQIKQMEQTLAPLKAEVARLERVENGKNGEPKDAFNPPPVKSVALAQDPPAPPKLELSQDEIRLIKDYIKPAPGSGQGSRPPINVGDPVSVSTIPLPSPVTDKLPKLLGGRFTIHNGAIIILKRGSRQRPSDGAPRKRIRLVKRI